LDPRSRAPIRIRHVTRELSTFSRPNDERRVLVDVAAIVRSVLRLVGKEIEARAAPRRGPGAIPAVLANEARLVQVLVNLVHERLASAAGARPARHEIGVRTATADGRALIEILGQRPGCPRRCASRSSSLRDDEGHRRRCTGLGLFVCRNIVKALEGGIHGPRRPGRRRALPRRAPGGDGLRGARHPADAPTGPAAGGDVRRRRVLITTTTRSWRARWPRAARAVLRRAPVSDGRVVIAPFGPLTKTLFTDYSSLPTPQTNDFPA